MEKIMNDENEWDQIMKADVVQGPFERVTREEIVEAMQKMKSHKKLKHWK